MTNLTPTAIMETAALKHVVISSSTVPISLMKDWLSWLSSPRNIGATILQRNNAII